MTPRGDVGWKSLPRFVLNEAGVERDGDLVVIPYRLADGGLYAQRVVAQNGRRWWRPGDGRAVIPFGLEQLADRSDRGDFTLLVAEGESDALALRYWAAVVDEPFDVLGIPGASCWRAEWGAILAEYATVYVLGDGDDAGRRFNWRVRRDHRPTRIVELPDGDDARAIVERSHEELDALLDRADAMALLERAFRCETLDEAKAMLSPKAAA